MYRAVCQNTGRSVDGSQSFVQEGKGNSMKVMIKKMGINGEGIGYLDRLPVFIPGALCGEEVEIKLTEKNGRYAKGKIVRILKKSDKRVRPICEIQRRCGACPYMVADYEEQLRFKQEDLRQSLIKYAHVDPRLIKKIQPSEKTLFYRNQCKLPCAMDNGELVNGMYMPNSNIFIPMTTCYVHEKELEIMRKRILKVLNRYHVRAYDWHQKRGLRYLILRGFEGKFQCTLVSGEENFDPAMIEELLSLEGLTSLWQSYQTQKKTAELFGPKMILLGGEKYLHLSLGSVTLPVSPRSFFQLNTQQAKKMYACIAEMTGKGHTRIVEAYSGIGGISMLLKDHAQEVIGIEIIKDAVLNARQSARDNHIDNVQFICADAADKLLYLSKKSSIDVLVVDPPRSGLDEAMLAVILRSKIKKIIYVSCNPSTLAKNLAVLKDRYDVEQVVPFDMFPNTAKVETIVALKRR